MQDLVSVINSRYQQVKADKDTTARRDQDLINEYVYPSSHVESRRSGDKEGERHIRQKIVDNIAERGIEDTAAHITNLLAPSGGRWLMLLPDDLSKILGKTTPVKKKNREYLELAQRAVEKYLVRPDVKFHLSFDETMIECCAKGTGVPYRRIVIDENGKQQLNYQSIEFDDCYFEEDYLGNVNIGYRCRNMTALQILQEYIDVEDPSHNFDEMSIKSLRDDVVVNPKKVYEVVQAMFPKGDVCYKHPECQARVMDKAYASVHIAMEVGNGKGGSLGMLRNGHSQIFNFRPYRFRKRAGKTYGFGPGHRCLSDLIALQSMKRSNVKASRLAVSPAWDIPYQGYAKRLNNTPNALNYRKKKGTGKDDKATPIFSVDRLPLGVDREDRTKADVEQSLYLDLLREAKVGEMSATESTIRQSERLSAISPVIARIVLEYLNKEIDFVYKFLIKTKQIPEPPADLKGIGVSPVYISQLMKAQANSDLLALERFANITVSLSQAFPGITETVENTEIVHYIIEKLFLPYKFLRDAEEIQESKENAQMQEEQQGNATALKDASQAQLNTARAASVLGGIGG